MKITVVGCGRMGAELAYLLFKQGHQVTVLDITETAFRNLPSDFTGRKVVGEILARDALHRAGIETADGLAAVTNSDAYNAVVGHLAREKYQVAIVVVRNYDPRWRSLHEAFGLQVISSSSWGAQRIADLLTEASLPVRFSAGSGEVEIYELTIPKAWHDLPMRELLSGEDCRAVALTRAGRATLPPNDAILHRDDILHISASPAAIVGLQKRLELAKGT
jgi:trk system potassium uptake protein